jgi:outer membrane protein assembly factor BamB
VRRVRAASGLILACAIVLAGCGTHSVSGAEAPASGAGAILAGVPSGDWRGFDYNAQRSGIGPASTGITAGRLGLLALRVVQLDGTVDSAPIELHAIKLRGRRRDVTVVTTTYGRTIALDAGTGARLWEFTPNDIRAYEGSAQVTTASPVADPDRRSVYAASPNGVVHKLALATGREVGGGHWPARITFDPTHEKLAAALNISGRSVVAVTGGYIGDAPPYQGHVALIDRASGRVTHVFNTLCSNRHHLIDPPSSCPASDSAIWARAGAVIEPGSGRILVATGNARFNGSTDWGDSVLELSSDAGRLLHNWTPTNQAQLNNSDGDVGSTAPALLPVVGGYHLTVQGGKDGRLHLLNLSRLNGTAGGPGARLGGEVQSIPSPGSGEVVTAPAVWTHRGGTFVFVADDSGTAAYFLQAGRPPHLRVAWQTGTGGTSPVLAGGLLYVYDQRGGRLDVYEPASGRRLGSLSAATGHWNSPIVVGGRIILPVGRYGDHSTHGTLLIYHLPGR